MAAFKHSVDVFALKLVFGLLGPLVGLLLWVLGVAIKIAIAGAVALVSGASFTGTYRTARSDHGG